MSAAEWDASLWERAFQLSYFILMDRSRARECVARALEKLAAQRTREQRRRYWRARRQQLTIRRISRPMEDTLQWLIFLEAEGFEKEQESQGVPTEADMIVRYIKHLAQLTTLSSSFHVNIGFNRLLRRYTTPEVQEIYELATGRYPGSEEYRKGKGKLLEQLAARFERFLKIHSGQYGELQFETHEEHRPWLSLVEECLQSFTPWSGRRSCLEGGARLAPGVRGASRHGAGSGNIPDRLETSRCHWFMHSSCYGQLAGQLGFDPPQERLSVPRFLHHDGGSRGSDPGSSQRRTAPLSQEETRILHEHVASVMAAGGAIALEPLKIVAHGAICARLDPSRNEHRRFEIPEGTRMLEIRSDITGSDRILATHWIDYGEDRGIVPGTYTLALRGGRQLVLSVLPTTATQEGHGAGTTVVTIESRAASALVQRVRSVGSFFSDRNSLLRPVLVSVALVAVGVLAASAFFGLRMSQDRRMMGRMAAELAQQRAIVGELATKSSAPLVAHYALSSDVPNLRGPGNPGEPVVSFAPGNSVIILELPVAAGEHGSYRATLSSFPQEHERLSEMALRPLRRADRWIVEFALPAALVENEAHYLLTLTQATGADSGRYIFKVEKK